jgi:hypothetical protein
MEDRPVAELDYLLLADGATQRPDGKIDIFGAGFDQIYASSVPVRHQQLSIVLRVLITVHEAENNHHLELILMSEDGPEVARASADVNPVPEEVRAQFGPADRVGVGAVLNLAGLIFPTFGRYHLAALWDGTELRQPVRLRLSPMPPPDQFGQFGIPGTS